jgi:exonuclease SbcC
MNLREMKLKGFMRHGTTKLAFPERGVVVVSGPNGAGKSSIVEAVAYGLYGETLRGTTPWQEGTAGKLFLLTDRVSVERSFNKRMTLAWKPADGAADTYETNTKAQEALEAIVGEFAVWRRSSVFSSTDAAHFTLASDSERKRLLESLLGLGQFDDALEKCRVDRKRAEQSVDQLLRAADVNKAKLEAAESRLTDARRLKATLTLPPKPLLTTALGPMLEQAKRDLEEVRRSASGLRDAKAEQQARAGELGRRLAALSDSACDKCGQPIPDTLRQALRAELDAAKVALKEATDAYAAAAIANAAAEEEIQDEIARLRAKIALYDQEDAAYRRAERAMSEAAAQLAAAEKQAETLRTLMETDAAGHQKAAAKLALYQSVEQVLGIKGVRAHVLGKALAGLEQAANAWLGRLAGGGLKLALKPYSEKKTGGVSDAIALEVQGAGGGYGYRAASGGERRRIDVALLLGLSQMAGGTGTLFFDEVFDALDGDGVEAVVAAIQQLAADRLVFVISHSDALLERLPAAKRLRVSAGAVEVS